MNNYLDVANFPGGANQALQNTLEQIMNEDFKGSFFALMGDYKKILGDNSRKGEWEAYHEKLLTLFKCGKSVPLSGPMIGVSMSIRDSDCLKDTAGLFGKERSSLANIEWMASLWNITFSDSGIWMGKTFEPVTLETVKEKSHNNPLAVNAYDEHVTRIGRNFFRNPHDPSLLQLAGIPSLEKFWKLKNRPMSADAKGFDGKLLPENLEKEKKIPYEKTGGYFLANNGTSVVPEMNNKPVYQLNYRWPGLVPQYPMTRLVDEIVQIDKGIYLGQLVMATAHYAFGTVQLDYLPGDPAEQLGSDYRPGQVQEGLLNHILAPFGAGKTRVDYGYQNNGFFLMIDPDYAEEAYADNAFPVLRPHTGESGYVELGYIKQNDYYKTGVMNTAATDISKLPRIADWAEGWKNDASLKQKFTTMITEASTKSDDPDVHGMLQNGESVLQMIKRIKEEVSAATECSDRLIHFEKLNRLFRSGVAPKVENGFFQGSDKGYNTRLGGLPEREWYGKKEPLSGFDYYHGCTLDLHFGFDDEIRQKASELADESQLFPSSIAALLQKDWNAPNLLNIFWANIGRFIFPWAGKSYEKVSGRKLSMLVDESADLKDRYPERVNELKTHAASWPHYDLVNKNAENYWGKPGKYHEHLKNGSWDGGMTDEDKAFWENEAATRWVFGNNLQDSRIKNADFIMKMVDMNYHIPEKVLQDLTEAGPSPFVRQGYIFLGLADQQSILPMNKGDKGNKTVFQFQYRYPMIGGATPIGFCLDEIVEIAEGLYLGQLIYSTLLAKPYHSSENPSEYGYQLFGYFMLMDNDWEYYRQAIKLDTLT